MSDDEGRASLSDYSDVVDDDFVLSDGEGPSFQLDIRDEGASGGFHTRNKKGMQQRGVVTDRGKLGKAAYNVKCKASAMIHGSMNGPGTNPATLMVYDCYFLKYEKGTRLKNAQLTFTFSTKNPEGITVSKISPFGGFAMMQTTQTEKVTRGANATAGAGILGADLSAGYKWETTTEAEVEDATALTGEILADGEGFENTAKFTLNENQTRKSGIPTFLRFAMLLERPEDDQDVFECVPNIDVKVNTMRSIREFFANKEVDDPVIMNPRLDPVNKLGIDIDPDNLDDLDLVDIFDCTFHSMVGGVVKSVKAKVKEDEKGVVSAEVTQVKEELVPAD